MTDLSMRSPITGVTLDLVTLDLKMKPLNGLVLDSSRLSAGERESLGPKTDDSLASAHLMLIGDFRAGNLPFVELVCTEQKPPPRAATVFRRFDG